MKTKAILTRSRVALAAVLPAAEGRGATRLLAKRAAAATFQPARESLGSQYESPEWFRNARFGIRAHGGPQCEPGQADGFARKVYLPGAIHSVRRLGVPGRLKFTRDAAGFHVRFPERRPCDIAFALRLQA
jgi:hypothetical protein